MTTTDLMNTTILCDAAEQMRGGGFSIPRIKYNKGSWLIDEVKINGREFGARPDWVHRGWTRWWNKRQTYFFGGYLIDKWVPPSREALPDKDEELWQIYCKGRDPWVLQFHLPFFDLATEDLFIWSTDTAGGESAIKALLDAFYDRCDLQPEDGAILPIVTLNPSMAASSTPRNSTLLVGPSCRRRRVRCCRQRRLHQNCRPRHHCYCPTHRGRQAVGTGMAKSRLLLSGADSHGRHRNPHEGRGGSPHCPHALCRAAAALLRRHRGRSGIEVLLLHINPKSELE